MADASSIVQQNLLDAKAKLVAQEQAVLAELERIRKGIASIETTIDVVCSGDMLELDAGAPAEPKKAEKAAELATPADTNGNSSVAAPKTSTRGRGRTAKVKEPKPAKEPKAGRQPKAAKEPKAAKAPAEKGPKGTSGRASKRNNAGWQTYLHDEFKDKALTEVVETVFSRSPKTAMSSSDLIDTIFTSEIPKTERTSARDRLLNILSIGVSENKWYRVKPGQYSVSKDAQ